MKLLRTINIPDEDYFPPNHQCTPIIWKEKLFYTFSTLDKWNIDESGFYGNKIIILEIDIQTKETIHKEISFSYNQKQDIKWTGNWSFFEEKNNLILYTGLSLDVWKSTITIVNKRYDTKDLSIQSSYNFGDKVLHYNDRSTIECFDDKTKKALWRQHIKGYIYTAIEKRGDCIFFGTAGKGWAFYCINIDDGRVLTEFNNTDASHFSRYKEYILIKDKKGNLVKLNPLNGEIIETVALKDKIHFSAPIYVHENKIFTRVYNKREKQVKLIYVKDY